MENIPNHIEAAATVSAPISLSAMQMVRIEATLTQFVKQSPSWWTSTSGFAVPLIRTLGSRAEPTNFGIATLVLA
ncbi:MAG: hypothetical protein IPJ73_17440 [Zoogloea sp.]|nr:hypothetical protein [Zoogloea sp.]